MDYDLKLQHKAGSKMIVTDALSRCADWSKGLDQDNIDVVALPDDLWIKLVDTELQDAVADAQKNDELAQEALRSLTDLQYPHLAGPLYPQDQTLPPI